VLSLLGEITEAPPVYRIFGSRLEFATWTLVGTFWFGFFIFPFLMWGGSDVVLYIGGLSVVCYGGWQAYRRHKFNQELTKLTKE
jgi:hypothetical protein